MIRTIERAKTHYEVFQLGKDADAKTIRTTMRRAPRRNQLQTRYAPSTRCWPRDCVGSMAWDSLVYLRTAEVTGILKDVFMS